MESMTVKEIAQAVGRDERTVRRWVNEAADKMSVIADKMSVSSPAKPASYTLPEVIEIIRAGAGDQVADTFATNAQLSNTQEKVATLPNGKQLEELRKIFGQEAGEIVKYVIGYGSNTDGKVEVIPVSGNLGRISPQAYAVEMRIRQQRKSRQIEDNSTPDLFTEES